MYEHQLFVENRFEVLAEVIGTYSLATFVHVVDHVPQADHLPMILGKNDEGDRILSAHVARANPLWKGIDEASKSLAVFQGPQQYISPEWYPSKKQHGKVVPTWNYIVVHVTGRVTVKNDVDWLQAHLESLTAHQESERQNPWKVSDAPEDFTRRQMRGIVGIEMTIETMIGKWKLSQNRTAEDRAGVVAGLQGEVNEDARIMAGLIPRDGDD